MSQGRTVLATDTDGFFDDGPDRGLFVHQTRLLSRYRWVVTGREWSPVALSNVAQHSWLGYYTCLPPGQPPGPKDEGSGRVDDSSERTLELRLSRHVGGGMHEDVDLENFSLEPTAFTLELLLDADFVDVEETADERRQRGRLERRWEPSAEGGELVFDYEASHRYQHQGDAGVAHLRRGLRMRVRRAASPPEYSEGRLRFRVSLEPRATWHACLHYVPVIDGETAEPEPGCRSFGTGGGADERRRALFLAQSTSFATRESGSLAPVVVGALEQAKHDLASLRLHDLDQGEAAWTMAAGLPTYVALFGRDTLTAAWQAALLGPEMMKGTLEVLVRYQGRTVNDWRDEQPGRMLHEAHSGPLAVLNHHPRRRYYGSITTSSFYGVVLSELWHWTGDKDLIRPLLRPALDALRWLDEWCLRDGFYEYRSRSEQGVLHQAWKDSRDALVDEDGVQVEPPIATCEEQAFAYAGQLQLAEVLWWMGEKAEARRLFRAARELKRRFQDAFWLEDEGFFAMALDAERRPIRSIGSNPGHCLAAGIVEKGRAKAVAQRLLAPDLFSGWGVRTLSSLHPAYNPYSYHRGSVWPVEHGSFAIGLLRYGLHAELWRLARAVFDAARLFEFTRLPEVFGGHARDEDHPFPALYLGTNTPQAWSASAVFCLLQAMLGLYPYAPLNLLLLDPWLPEWLPEITLRNLRVGAASVDLRFERRGSRTEYEVRDKRGTLHVVRQPSPWSLTAGFGERLRDALTSLLPGR